MSHPLVVHCKKDKYDVYCGRPSIWGNPYQIGTHGTRKQVIDKYKKYLLANQELLGRIHELRGKVLGCWCAPMACHCDVLADFANT